MMTSQSFLSMARRAGPGVWVSLGGHAALITALFLWTYHAPAPNVPQNSTLSIASIPVPLPAPAVLELASTAVTLTEAVEQSTTDAPDVIVEPIPEMDEGADAAALLAMLTPLKRSIPSINDPVAQGDFALAEPQLNMDRATVDNLVHTALMETKRRRTGWGPWGFQRVGIARCIPANEGIP